MVNYFYTGLYLLVQLTYIFSLSHFNKYKNYSFSEFLQVIRKKRYFTYLQMIILRDKCMSANDVEGGVR